MVSLELEPELITGLYDRVWEERRVVALTEVPPLIVKAILAVEDERFYHHHGIDPVSVVRAVWVNLRSGGVVQGGSTLTQQLMKNFFLSDERKFSRKIKEAIMALIAERKYYQRRNLGKLFERNLPWPERLSRDFRHLGGIAVLFLQAIVRAYGGRGSSVGGSGPSAEQTVSLSQSGCSNQA